MADSTTKETVILDFQVDTKSAVVSIDNLTKANKALREERKNLDTTTKEGQDRIKEINSQLDKNTSTIKDNSSALEKQRMNIGNYSGALDKLVPGLSGTVNGMLQMGKAMWALVANPLGAFLAVIGAALGSLIAYFKSSEEGQNRLNKIMLVFKTIIEQLKNFVEDFGEAVFDAFTNPKQALIDFGKFLESQIVNRFVGMLELGGKLGKAFTLLFAGEFKEAATVAGDAVGKVVLGVENATSMISNFAKKIEEAVNTGIEEGKLLADMQAKIDKDERKLVVDRAKTNLEVSKKRREAVTQEGDEKRATIMEAIALEEALAEKETAHAQLKLSQAQLELKANGDDKAAKLKVAEAEAALINAEASRYEATLRFSKEIEKLDDAERARKEKLAADMVKLEETKQKQIGDKLKEVADQRNKEQEQQLQKSQDDADKQIKIKENIGKAEIGVLNKVTDEKSTARAVGTALFKKDALKEVAINTKDGAIAAYRALAGIPIVGPALGIVAAAAVIAYGAIQAAGIAGIGFRKGGFTGDGDPNQAAGIVHKSEFVIPANVVSQFGKDHFQSYMDGSIMANASTSGIGGSSQSQAPIYLGLKEFNEFKSRVELKESIVTA